MYHRQTGDWEKWGHFPFADNPTGAQEMHII
jgi:hypothetical protein